MKNLSILTFCVLTFIALTQCKQASLENNENLPPQWAKNAIWYQVFVERFNNGDPSNDPGPENINARSNFKEVPDQWSITPWTADWFAKEEWAQNLGDNFYSGLQLRRFGGDLQGVLDKIDHLEELGINAIYFNPLNDAPSLHKYDARNYRHIDVNFGPDPAGDNKIIQSEIPEDPSTWKWTSADKLFLKLVEELHKRDIRVIMDYSWNHTGVEFWAWKDIVKNQQNSKYKDWYNIISFDDPQTPDSEFKYHGWLNIQSLPELKKVKVTTERVTGHPYEGDIHPQVKKHIFEVTKRWLAPDGDISKGIDGYRLDVADHIGMVFWRDWRKHVRSINPEAYLVGEVWWEKWPDQLMNPVPYLGGDIFDAIMFYQVYRPARYFFAKTDFEITAEQLVDSLNFQWNRLREETRFAMMNTAATHDSPRLLTSFNNPNKYKHNANIRADSLYKSGKPDPETYIRTRLYLIHQFTSIGAPQIWNGDELGMWGGDDPNCRKPLWWPEYTFDSEINQNGFEEEKRIDEVGYNSNHFEFYKLIARMRTENPVLKHGELEFLKAEGKLLSYKRWDGENEVLVMFNLSSENQEFKLPEGFTYQDILYSSDSYKSSVTIEPLSAVVCKKIN